MASRIPMNPMPTRRTLFDLSSFPYPGELGVGDPVWYDPKKRTSYQKIPAYPKVIFRGVSRTVKHAHVRDHPVLQMGPFTTPRFVQEQPFLPLTCSPQTHGMFRSPPQPMWTRCNHSIEWCRLAHAYHWRPWPTDDSWQRMPQDVTFEDQLTDADRIFMWVVARLLQRPNDDFTAQELEQMYSMRHTPHPIAHDFDLRFDRPAPQPPLTPIVSLGYTASQLDALLYY
jgi:hypothetical protein